MTYLNVTTPQTLWFPSAQVGGREDARLNHPGGHAELTKIWVTWWWYRIPCKLFPWFPSKLSPKLRDNFWWGEGWVQGHTHIATVSYAKSTEPVALPHAGHRLWSGEQIKTVCCSGGKQSSWCMVCGAGTWKMYQQ